MSLRQAKDAPADPPDDDEEKGLLDNAPERAPPRPSPVRSAQQQQQQSSSPSRSVMSAFDSMASATRTQNPIMLAKLIFRKFLHLLTTDEDESDPRTPFGYTIALLKDIILGIVFGFLTISFAIVLDHRNIIHFQSAHHVRDAAYASMSDPATIKVLEEELEMKFMPVADYEAAQQEISKSQSTLDEIKSKLESREKELEEATTKLKAVQDEKEELMKNPKFAELDNFCEGCKWGGPGNCGARVQYLMDTYNQGKIAVMLDLMGKGLCKKN